MDIIEDLKKLKLQWKQRSEEITNDPNPSPVRWGSSMDEIDSCTYNLEELIKIYEQ